jgi:diguanylate cyclase (GGDEF)-like protein
MKILVAEDQPTAALLLGHMLKQMGHDVAFVRDGEEAWTRLETGDAPLLISDWMMPQLDGLELCRRIRAAAAERYTYIILLTSRDRREDRLEGLRAGADDFLTKPPDPDELAVRLEIAQRLLAVYDQLARQNARLAELVSVDELTGAKNRRRFREDLQLLFSQSIRLNVPLSLIMLDIDRFKAYNDAFGHPAGDEVLRKVVATLQATVRGHDVVARYGGEEFAVLLPMSEMPTALEVAERLRKAIACGPWPLRDVTASFGVATKDRESANAATLVDQADQALYHAKEAGRNRVVCFGAELAPCSVR